ncbi:FitA-like ribbon-helix-helix domain-containing protein [Paralcaligenes ureilyticus]|uniref:Antitoxin FitA-like ribbon-helix-helix domain-containing protein n=1 Tax=Paralcaligenes ureilyticus TaxID=627131 RepID=A0A4R3M2I2_9BURK|nr:plasmid stabilization protein [Paralcaligenes ureilyticus]TCT07404.1 hypothetical protein EDC26_106128 [Paralcaligenes ureilyticus]
MASLTIRNLNDEIKARLRLEAAEHGHSMEEEARRILRIALETSHVRGGLGSRIHRRFSDIGGAELDIPARTEPTRSVDFHE